MGLTPQKAGESQERLAEIGARRTSPYLGLDFVLTFVLSLFSGNKKEPCGSLRSLAVEEV